MLNYRKLTAAILTGTIAMFTVTGCTMPWETASKAETQSQTEDSLTTALTDSTDLSVDYTDEELNDSFNASECSAITLGSETVEITKAGTYLLSGTLTENSIHVNCTDKGTVRLIFNGVNISNASAAPVIIEEAKKVIITLADGTDNTITDSARATATDEEYSAAISSKADLTINGKGTLTVNAGYRNGIKSSDDLKIISGTFNINSKEDGIVGKDLLAIRDGNYTITAGTDGMKSTYDTDTTKGNVIIEGGQIEISSQNDGIQAENILLVSGGILTIKTGEGASESLKTTNNFGMTGASRFGGDFKSNTANSTASENSESLKGLKATNAIYLTGGTYTIDSEDDSIHTNGESVIDNGTFDLSTGDDGIHADNSLEVNGGTIDIKMSYEGLEAEKITINQGNISIISSDDGINAANSDSSTTQMGGGMRGSQAESTILLTINAGTIRVHADGDGLDSNGSVVMNGGDVVVLGPTNNNNAALDFENQFEINGGSLMAFGSSGMLETPTSAANGCCLVASFTAQNADTVFELKDASGNTVMNYTPDKSYSSAIVYADSIESGKQYTMNMGNTSVELTAAEGVTTNGTAGMGGTGGMKGGHGAFNGATPDGTAPDNMAPDSMGQPNGAPEGVNPDDMDRKNIKQNGGQRGRFNSEMQNGGNISGSI